MGVLDFQDLLIFARDSCGTTGRSASISRKNSATSWWMNSRTQTPFRSRWSSSSPKTAPGRRPGGGGPQAGKLFLVGDPKQSIYRFRRPTSRPTRKQGRGWLAKASPEYRPELSYRPFHPLLGQPDILRPDPAVRRGIFPARLCRSCSLPGPERDRQRPAGDYPPGSAPGSNLPEASAQQVREERPGPSPPGRGDDRGKYREAMAGLR